MKMAPVAQFLVLSLLVKAGHALDLGVSSRLRGGKIQSIGSVAEETDSSSLQKLLVKQLLSGELSVSKAIQSGFENMAPEEAEKRLDGKLPPEVASLVHMTTTASEHAEFTEVSLAKARDILNTMIENSWVELDDKVIECKEFEERNRGTYTQVVADMARLSAQIAALEKEEARANNEIEAADSSRSVTETQMSKVEQDYLAQKLLDEAEMTKRKADLAVFDFILNMTACQDSAALLQADDGVKVCQSAGGQLELNFDSPAAQQKLRSLMTPEAREIIRAALGTYQQKQLALLSEKQDPSTASTFFSNQTVAEPPTAMPETLPVNEKPDPSGQWKKCTQEPNCGLLHDTMSLEWGKFKDEVDSLQHTMTKRSDAFLESKKTLNDMLTMLSNKKASEMVALDDATAKKGTDMGELKDKTEHKHQLQHEFDAKMKECDAKITEILFTNICAVRSVRNEVMEFSSVSPQSKISDCDVKDWVPGDCTVACDDACPKADPYECGGWQLLTRAVIVAPNNYGIQCPALQRKKKCNQFKCPVDCGMSMWTTWGKCSKDCEGGVQSKTRAVIVRPKNGGEMCDTVQESRSCNTGSCDRDCTLHPWTEWAPCSMACSGGEQDRIRTVEIPIRGEGTCPKRKHVDRYEKQECNTQDCVGDEICIMNQDLVLLIDASGSLREGGYTVVRNYAANLTDRYASSFKGDGNRVRMGAVLFGNGRLEPNGVIAPAIRVSDITNETTEVKKEILATTWQRGFTNLAQGFVLADVLLQQKGRPDAQSAVMVIWDGKYSFAFETGQKARMLKDKNVQIYMAVIAGRVTDDQAVVIHKWASHPWETNYEHIPGLDSLESSMDVYINKAIAKFCPSSYSPSSQKKMDDISGYSKIKQNAIPGNGCATPELIGEFATKDDCFAAAQAKGSQIFSYDRKWREQKTSKCYIAMDFEAFDLAKYNTWTNIFTASDGTHMKFVGPTYGQVLCPNGPADKKDKFVDGWQIQRRFNTYAIKPTAF